MSLRRMPQAANELALSNGNFAASYNVVVSSIGWSGDNMLAFRTPTNATVLCKEMSSASSFGLGVCWRSGVRSIEIKLNRGGHAVVSFGTSALLLTVRHALTVKIEANGMYRVERGGAPRQYSFDQRDAEGQSSLIIDENGELRSSSGGLVCLSQ